MRPTNSSEDLYLRLIVMFIVFLITGFMIPQEMLGSGQLLLLWVVLPLVGWLWIQAYIDAANE